MRFALALSCLASLALAEPMGRDINPGVLGPNALAALATDSPWVRNEVRLQLGWAGQLSTPEGGGLDGSMVVPFRLELGLYERIAFWAEGSPFELWQYSPETYAAWQPKRSKGITRADVRLGTRVRLWSDSGLRPASAVRVVLKTATGEDLYTRRFLDAPAYQFDLINAWHWLLGSTRLEARLAVGFLAWQQGAAGQNDAVALAGALLARWAHVSVWLELRGYAGWLRNDTPVVASAQADFELTPMVDVLLGVSRTFRDPPTFEVSTSLRFRLPTD